VFAIATADVNHDGKLDLIAASVGASGAGETVLLGNGDGTFQSPIDYPGGPNPTFAIGDVNGDGKLDLAFPSTDGLGHFFVSAALGNGDGTFQSPVTFGAAAPNGAIVAGDFNGDGKLDFALTNVVNGASTVATPTTLLQGLLPVLNGSPDPLVFPEQAIGTTSAPQTVTLTNSGTAAASIAVSSIGFSGTNAGEFSQTNNCTSTIATGASCQLNVTFTPTAFGNQYASLSIPYDAAGSPKLLGLVGSGPAPPPPPPPPAIVTVSPSTVTFPGQYVGTSGLPQTVTVTNTGTVTLAVTAVTASPADFGVLSSCGNPVAVGSSCTIGVFFDPTAGGTRTGTLKITDNAGNSPQTVALTGSGLDFSMTPSSVASATVTAGQTASYSIAVAPAGGFAANVALSCSGGPAGSACAVSPSTIALSGAAAQTAMVTVKTAANGWLLPFRGGWPRDVRYRQTPMILTLAAMFLLMVVASLFWWREQNLVWIRVVAFAALVTLGMTLTSCGGGSGSGGGGTNPQAGTYTISVTGNFTTGSTTLTHAAKLTLVVQ